MIAAALGVKDEVDLVERSLAHLKAIGVELVLACDVSSTDGTAELLERHRSEDWLWLYQIGQEATHEEWEEPTLELIARSGADWVIFVDVDEFVLPSSGTLADCSALADADVVSIDRFNVPLTASGPAFPEIASPDRYDEVLLVSDPVPDFWERSERGSELPWTLAPIAPRVMARTACIERIMLGYHDVHPPAGIELRRSVAGDVVVAHLGFTTFGRFERKVENIREALALHPTHFPEGWARHWKRWAAQTGPGELEAEFGRMVFDDELLAELRDEGRVRAASQLLGFR